jgi:hypothetical protein
MGGPLRWPGGAQLLRVAEGGALSVHDIFLRPALTDPDQVTPPLYQPKETSLAHTAAVSPPDPRMRAPRPKSAVMHPEYQEQV